MPDLNVLAISGSLRKGSYNTALLRAAAAMLPAGMRLTFQPIHEIPLFNGDVEAQGLPPSVVAFKDAVRAADGVLISTPEYNHGVPGVLKNAIDWSSRGGQQPWARKPVAVISASNGRFGGVRSQLMWLPILSTLGAIWMHAPEFFLSQGGEAFNADGSLKDAATAQKLRELIVAFDAWIRGYIAVGSVKKD